MLVLKVLDSSRRWSPSGHTWLQVLPTQAAQHSSSQPAGSEAAPDLGAKGLWNAWGLPLQSEEGIWAGRGAILMSSSNDSITRRRSCWRTGRDTGHVAADQVTSIREPLYISPPQLSYVSGYKSKCLWTQVQAIVIVIYRMKWTAPHRSFCYKLVSERWLLSH